MTRRRRQPGPEDGQSTHRRGRRIRGRKGARSPGEPHIAVHAERPHFPPEICAYLAPPGLEEEVAYEVQRHQPILHQHARLLIAEGAPRRDVAWAQDVWLDTKVTPIASIGDANRQLRAIQRSWVPYSATLHRRVALIADALPPVRPRRWGFPCAPPSAALGAFTLLDRETMVYSATRRSAFPHGEVAFEEDREGPPSRAYQKLWEALILAGVQPQPNARCLDLGASPGGWTWVLAELGAKVMAVDRAPLAPELLARSNVRAETGSAFALDPADALRANGEPYDWLFSDIICEPARLLRLVKAWLDAGATRRVVCTLKFRGQTAHDVVEAFAQIPRGHLRHLSHNRHELTFFRLAEGEDENFLG